MKRLSCIALVLGLSACDVEASLGANDAGVDAVTTLDGSHAVDTGTIDGGLDSGPPDAQPPGDAGNDAAPTCAVPDAGACGQCQAAMCCAEYTACQAAPTCPCIVDCIFAGHGAAACATHCGAADHGESDALVACAQHQCVCP